MKAYGTWCPSPAFLEAGLSNAIYILVWESQNKELEVTIRIMKQRVAKRTKGSTDKKSGAFEREKALGGFTMNILKRNCCMKLKKNDCEGPNVQNQCNSYVFVILWISPNSLRKYLQRNWLQNWIIVSGNFEHWSPPNMVWTKIKTNCDAYIWGRVGNWRNWPSLWRVRAGIEDENFIEA